MPKMGYRDFILVCLHYHAQFGFLTGDSYFSTCMHFRKLNFSNLVLPFDT